MYKNLLEIVACFTKNIKHTNDLENEMRNYNCIVLCKCDGRPKMFTV